MSDKPDTDSKLGHDPLDWLKEDSSEATPEVSNSAESEPVTMEDDSTSSVENDSPDDIEKNETVSEPGPEPESEQEKEEPLLFEGGLTVAKMEALKPIVIAAIEALPQGFDWSVDFSNVTQIDSSGYQLMISTLNTCDVKQISVTLIGMNEEVKAQLVMLGDQRLLATLEAA